MKILVLYYELAAYNMVCFNQLNAFDEVHIVAYPINKEAPFVFKKTNKVTIHNREDYDESSLIELYNEIQPELLFCAGWNDKDYLSVVKNSDSSTNVLGLDNQWEGNLKQRLGVIIKGRTFKKLFDYVFVPGLQQKEFASRLGFPEENIIQGAYSCDFNFFEKLGKEVWEEKKIKFPKRFLYVGRYIKRKGIYDMWDAFIDIQNEQENEWELWCLGTGELYDTRVKHGKIKHFGFVQPDEIEFYIKNTGVFLLPSHFEPWGVVAHEFAAARFPLLLSNKIGAGTVFLQEKLNGFSFAPENKESLKTSMLKIINSSDQELITMGEKSHELAQTITPETWAKSILEMAKT